MNAVITSQQAKQITGGRAPLVPVEYDSAVRALIACSTLDEAKYWSSKADALAAWAKIYGDDKVGREAKRLRLYAYRRMGEIARELRPGGVASSRNPHPTQKGAHRFSGRLPGPKSLLEEQGLNDGQTRSALRVSRIPKKEFDAFVNSPKPPSPVTIGSVQIGVSRDYELFNSALTGFVSCLKARGDPKEFVKQVPPDSKAMRNGGTERIRARVAQIIEWLDTFEQYLPKEKAK